MPQTPFKAITWTTGDPITKDKMDAMANNDIWLKENSPRAHYSKVPGDEEYESGLVLVSGRAYVPRRMYDAIGRANVYFGSAFLPTTRPQVTTGIVSDTTPNFWVILNGLPGVFLPDYRGFQLALEIETPATRPRKVRGRTQTNPLARSTYVCWQALGQAKVQV